MKGGNEIVDIHSHRVIKRQKIIVITIPNEIIKHIEEIFDHDKVTLLRFNNIAGVVYDNDWISGVQYEDNEDKNEYYSEENQEDKYYT